jgi:spermidine synthase
MNRQTWSVAALLFCSGLAALVYQTVWLREFRLVFGASTAATAAVLAVFMGGLGAGSAMLGKRADRWASPLRLYGNLEIGIAASAAFSIPLLWIVRELYLGSGGSIRLGIVVATVVRLLLAAFVLAAPTFLMGGTLPAAARAVATSADTYRRSLALLYGMNTLGAVTGTLLSTFFMLEVFGNRGTLVVAACLNALVGMVARAMSRKMAAPETAPQIEPMSAEAVLSRPIILAAAAIAGFTFLLMELVWYRMLSPLLGGTTFTFGLILAMALLGVGLGGILYMFWNRASGAALAMTAALEALAIALPFALGDHLAVYANLLRALGSAGFEGYVLGWLTITAVVVLPASLIAGFQFPLLIGLLGQGSRDVGRDVGLAYAWNTAGAIAGSLAGGFGLLPLLTAPGAWRLAIVLLGLMSIAIAVSVRRIRWSVLTAAGAAAFAFATGPTSLWRHSGIGGGRLSLPASPNELRDQVHTYRRNLTFEADGRESSIALLGGNELSFIVNGKSDGSARNDAGTQVMMGLVGAALHPNPRSALVIGLGTGSTAGWLGKVSTMVKTDVVELEPAVVRVARELAAVNQDVLRNDRVHVLIADAREILLVGKQRYDLIVSEPSNPYRAGVSSLFTAEFYRAAANRLEDNGIFLQWLQAYDISAETLQTIYASLDVAFPHVDTFYTQKNDLLLVATRTPLLYDVNRIRTRIAQEPLRTAATQVWRTSTAEGFLSYFVANERTAKHLAKSATDLNTDDRSVIEFTLARSISLKASVAEALGKLAVRRGEDWPLRLTGTVDRKTADESRAASSESPWPARGRQLLARRQLMVSNTQGDLKQGLAIWSQQPWQVVNIEEAAAAAESAAERGDDQPLHDAAVLLSAIPIERDAIAARVAFRRRSHDQAAALLARAFVAYRSNPWPKGQRMRRALELTIELGRQAPHTLSMLVASLSRPFIVGQNEEARHLTLLTLATDIERRCGPLTLGELRVFEPYPPWNGEHLALRVACYSRNGPPELAERAVREYNEFLAAEAAPVLK